MSDDIAGQKKNPSFLCIKTGKPVYILNFSQLSLIAAF